MRILTLLCCALILGSCGTAYQSTTVREGSFDGTKVRVLALTPETVLAANRAAYVPQGLPAAFGVTAGAGQGQTYASALPAPASLPQTRTTALETRLPPAVAAGPYRIGVGDVVILATRQPGGAVADLPGLLAAQNRRQGYTVQDDGAIAVPDVGRIRIVDMTLQEAEAEVFQRLVAHQIDPSFSLEIAEFNARRVAIGGAVARPGIVPVTLTALTLDGVLAASGGATVRDRDSAAIRIYRDGALYQIPLSVFQDRADLQKLGLVDGDSVFVDTGFDLDKAQAYFAERIRLEELGQTARIAALQALTTEISLQRADLAEARQNFQDRLALGAERRDYVYVTGEVKTQARYPLPYGQKAHLADALFDTAGGIARGTGNPRQIYVMRTSPDVRDLGGVTAWHLDAGNAGNLPLATAFELRPNDVILVSEQPVTRWARVVNQIVPSLIVAPLNAAAN